jgi:hypothetical protein
MSCVFEAAKVLSWFIFNKKATNGQTTDKQNIIKLPQIQSRQLSTGCTHTNF